MKDFRRYPALLLLLLSFAVCSAQEPDTIPPRPVQMDTLQAEAPQNLLQNEIDSLTSVNKELRGKVSRLELKLEQLEEKQKFYEEKEWFYKVEAMRDLRENNEKLLEEKDHYQQLSDSLRTRLIESEKTILRTSEELKYTQQRAKDAEERISTATARKKKVCAIQGIAMKTFRTPSWSLAPNRIIEDDGTVRVGYQIVNKNGGTVEFDYTAGAYVMLWDLTRKSKEIKKFDQDFSYSLGLYVGFGGSNLFKNFYVGPSFKFLDFFHFTAGINVCEYEMLTGTYQEGDELPAGFSLNDQISKVWKTKPFFSLSFDLDFISYIKK